MVSSLQLVIQRNLAHYQTRCLQENTNKEYYNLLCVGNWGRREKHAPRLSHKCFRWSVLFSSLSIQKKSRTLPTKIFSGLARSENASWRIYRYFPCTFRLFGRPISIFTYVVLISRKKQFIAKNLRMGRERNCISVK